MFKNASNSKDWFVQKLTIEDTGVVSKMYINTEREDGMSEEMIQQEYYCSFDIGAIGSYYATQMEEARTDSRIRQLPFSPDVPVDLYFDLWVNDSFTISFKQNDGNFFNFVNYYENTGKTLDHYFSYIDDYLERKNWKLGTIYLPHDSTQKAHSFLVSGITILEKFIEKYGSHKVKKVEKGGINLGIQEVRKVFPRMRFDIESCAQLIKCLENYKKDWDDKKKVFLEIPRHDWASHGADNIRYFAVSPKDYVYTPKKRERTFFNRKTWRMEKL